MLLSLLQLLQLLQFSKRLTHTPKYFYLYI
jgi:hypothetical protein